jgi:D-alanyl-lipoteichoic acid acyltransferase DltB (MBOAT superfamily)
MNTFGATVDQHLLVGLAVSTAFSIALLAFSFLRQRRYLCIVSLLAAAGFHWFEFLGFALVNAVAYAIVRGLSRQSSGARRWNWACIALVLLIATFVFGRVYHWDYFAPLSGSVPIAIYALDMWLVLRLVTLFWEVGSGSIQAPSLIDFTIWTCLPLTLMGPLIRFSQFPGELYVVRTTWKSSGWWRQLAAGAAKLVTGQALYFSRHIMATQWPEAHLWNNAAITFVINPLGFYLSTAGYFDLMQTLGQLCGFKLPASFNFPIGRENISAFWMNWNMTATFVFRDYIFYNRWGLRGYYVYFNTLLLFTLVGLWHAANAYWILWGFLHGLLFCTFLMWRKYNVHLKALPFRGTFVSSAAARILTYVCVCACWYLPSKILQKLSGA